MNRTITAHGAKRLSWLWFGASWIGLLVACSLTRGQAIDKHNFGDFAQMAAWNLTRGVNAVYIVISLIALLIPPAIRAFRKQFDITIWWAPIAILANVVVEKLGKTLLHLPRPSGARNGFPSGHAMFSFLLAYLIAQKYPKLAPLFYGVAVAISWSRVEGAAHFPYQVLGGALIGTLLGAAISTFVKARDESETSNNVVREPIPRV